MKKRYVPLFWKFSIGIIIAVLFFSIITIPFIYSTISKSLERESTSKIHFISQSVAQKSISNLLYDEVAELNKLVDETCKIDSNIAYIFILDAKKHIVARSFENGVPAELINANNTANKKSNIVLIQSKTQKEKYILDIAEPILDGALGTVRIGIYEDQIKTDISFIYKSLLIIIFLFLINSLFFAFLYSYLITVPTKFISKIAHEINLETLQNCVESKNTLEASTSFRLRRLFFANDEIDTLYTKFINMLERLHKTHNEMQQTNKAMLNSEKLASIGLLASGIAHEINNPIIGLHNCLNRISHNPNDINQTKKYIELMSESVEKMETVVQGLLNYSRKQDFKLLKINLNSCLENALNLAAYHLERNQISTRNNLPSEIPFILGSRNHLEQVFLNLIINSIDAIVEKKKMVSNHFGEITFDCTCDENNFNFLLHDNGIGIKKENLSTIFDPFFTTKEVGHGTGLGLSISFNIISKHNGEINIDSEYGLGTTVKITFPINQS